MPSAVTSASDPDRVEVVTTVQCRRRWPLSEKLRPVARRYGIAPSLLFRVEALDDRGRATKLCGHHA
jgi:transposase-like protein